MTVKPWKLVRNLKLQPPNFGLTLLHSEYVHMRGEMNSNWYEILFRLKILFGVQSVFYLCSHKLRQNENQTGMVFMLDILTEMKFQTGEIFITTKFTQSKINKHKLFGYCIYNACAFETHCSHFARNEISFRVIKYQVKTTWDKMHTDIILLDGFEIQPKWKVSRTCFPAGWKSEIGMSSFSFSEPILHMFLHERKNKKKFFPETICLNWPLETMMHYYLWRILPDLSVSNLNPADEITSLDMYIFHYFGRMKMSERFFNLIMTKMTTKHYWEK